MEFETKLKYFEKSILCPTWTEDHILVDEDLEELVEKTTFKEVDSLNQAYLGTSSILQVPGVSKSKKGRYEINSCDPIGVPGSLTDMQKLWNNTSHLWSKFYPMVQLYDFSGEVLFSPRKSLYSTDSNIDRRKRLEYFKAFKQSLIKMLNMTTNYASIYFGELSYDEVFESKKIQGDNTAEVKLFLGEKPQLDDYELYTISPFDCDHYDDFLSETWETDAAHPPFEAVPFYKYWGVLIELFATLKKIVQKHAKGEEVAKIQINLPYFNTEVFHSDEDCYAKLEDYNLFLAYAKYREQFWYAAIETLVMAFLGDYISFYKLPQEEPKETVKRPLDEDDDAEDELNKKIKSE